MIKTEIEKLNKVSDKICHLANLAIAKNNEIFKILENQEYGQLSKIQKMPTKQIQALADDIDNGVVTILSLYCPEAKDLRSLISFLKITTELVRVQTNTYSFLKEFNTAFSTDLKYKKIMNYVLPMYKNTVSALTLSVTMINEDDHHEIQQLFNQVYTEESQTDQLYQLVESDIIKWVSKDIELSVDYLDLLKSIRRIEKIADRALNIASLLYFAKIGGSISQEIKVG